MKRISNATRSTDMPSQREGGIGSHSSPKVQSSGRRSISPTVPGGMKRGTLKTTLPSGKKKTCNMKTKKFFYQRSYDELVEGKIERRHTSPYYKKTVSFMAKNLD